MSHHLQTPLGLLTLLQYSGVGKTTCLRIACYLRDRQWLTDIQSQSLSSLPLFLSPLQASFQQWQTMIKHEQFIHDLSFQTLTPQLLRDLEDEKQWTQARVKAQAIIDLCYHYHIKITHYFADDYPLLLRMMPQAPPILYYRGELPKQPCMSIVGSRQAIDWSLHCCIDSSMLAVQEGWGVISGLAKGIDVQAHRSTLQARGYTAAVLAGGLDKIYPSEHHDLASMILEQGGALISETPPHTHINSSFFIQRNRIQSALGVATFVIQSSKDGGSMHTARFAKHQKRTLMVPAMTTKTIRQYPHLFTGITQLTESSSTKVIVDPTMYLKTLKNLDKSYQTLTSHAQQYFKILSYILS